MTAEIAARMQSGCFDDLDAPVERVGAVEVPLPYAKNLERAVLVGEDKIAARAGCARCRGMRAIVVLRSISSSRAPLPRSSRRPGTCPR